MNVMNFHLRPRRLTLALKYALRLAAGLACLLWLGALAARAADRYVSPPGGYGTNDTAGGYTSWKGAATNIQWALDKAANGETVWVTNGTYYLTNQIGLYASVLLQGVNGMAKTFINGNYPAYTNRCLYIENTGAVVKGFTIMNAFWTNVTTDGTMISGGGVMLGNGTLRNCHITTNFGNFGGGIQINGDGASVYDCIISSNSGRSGLLGGGIFCRSVGNIISNCVFRENYTPYRGGGIYINASKYQNRAVTVINCTFISNSAVNLGGGVAANGVNNIFRNCVFIGNSSGWVGGLMDLYASDTKIQNCTFVRNGTDGLYRMDTDGGLVENCIVASNAYTPTALTTNLNNRTDSTITVGAVNMNNITNNTAFVNYAADNFRLAFNSPCVNRGTNGAWMTDGVDLDGRARIRYGTVDMGAYERVNEGAIFSFH